MCKKKAKENIVDISIKGSYCVHKGKHITLVFKDIGYLL